MNESKMFLLREKVLKEIPSGELPWGILGRLMLKTGFSWAILKEDAEVTPEQFAVALKSVEEIFGKKIYI